MLPHSPFRPVVVALALALVFGGVGEGFGGLSQARAQDEAEKSFTETLGELFRDTLSGPETDKPAEDGPDASARPATQPAEAAAKEIPASRGEMVMSFSPLVKQTAPAVVNVYADRTVVRRSPFEGDPFFEQFFGRSLPNRTQKQSSLGSGVIVEKSGIVVTNNHVISDADDIRVALSDGREFESKVLLKDERFDLAVLKIDSSGEFPTVGFGDSDAMEVGDLVLAIGNPFGVGQTVTSGIVSALARNRIGVSDFGFFIQTDAAINPGNSGGALIDMHGNLIGINTAIFSRSGGSNGIGFAIPANLVRAFAMTAEAGGDRFDPPYIGATFQQVTPDIAEALGMAKATGALVVSVDEGGPAEEAGLRSGDIITAFNGQPIEHPDALGYRLATAAIGDTVDLTVTTNGGEETLAVELIKTPEDMIVRPVPIDGDSPFAGASVQPLSPADTSQLKLPSDLKGVVITAVAQQSLAAQYGFRPGDVITSVNGNATTTPEELQAAADERGFTIRFDLIRNGRRIRQMLNR
ncbi:MAG: serine protease [Rhizobiales bacterium]|nr:serine protease [Hyphomicrobiales bacterium]|tara:strand:+ start:91 stop:1662 length:1572 start_codon:yes stop_codon:yes gene_type:complete